MLPIEWRLIEAGFCRHPEFMVMRGGTWRAAEFPALVAVLDHPTQGRVLFDTGYSSHFMEATQRLPGSLYRAVTPVEFTHERSVAVQLGSSTAIRHVIVSHFHGDHVGGVRDFATAELHCSRAGLADLRSHSRLGALKLGLLPELLPPDFAARVCFFEDQPSIGLPDALHPFTQGHDVLGDGSVLAVALPGHAAGHFGIVFRDTRARTIFLIADAAWSSEALERNAPPPALVSAWLGETTAYRLTLSRLHELRQRSPQICLVPSHCRRWRETVSV